MRSSGPVRPAVDAVAGGLRRVRGLLGGWEGDPAWAHVYAWSVDHPGPGAVGWRAAVGSDLQLLLDAADETGTLPAGSRVLDVPCGSGVALRGLRPGQGLEYVAADIAPAMLERTRRTAADLGVADQVTCTEADVAALPFTDASFDRVLSLTGLHCFPDPAAAFAEMARVLRPGGVLLGSALLTDTGLRHEPVRRIGRLAGLLGPMCSSDDVRRWATAHGVPDLELRTSGALAYFRGTRA
ncbi:methyltransferase domain-containing protein [Nocardioides sp. ChNu-153]|uniref:class I SAM-dependent methyltransferase n=1 Tax=unclassified Nocardioides TaxID=2615069 RepID=UPI00240769C1|nr:MULTISPECIES: methyltransferase domain-containing protein [unclassified Nocardioides]MDF9716254.1 methyltransferase domain-containing protein [Nocardioides sp. ChNu-99]MDN7122004.1 methyltransferase domain-containing protein [Nocardioides sp. ChNu-153]